MNAYTLLGFEILNLNLLFLQERYKSASANVLCKPSILHVPV